jgi:hypothetical protein
MNRGASFDNTATYRYNLWREWDSNAPRVGFVMLNPSRADAIVDDPTIRRCIGFARSWGFGGLEVVNLFAYRTAHPNELRKVNNPVGVENDRYLASLNQRVDRVIVAWGNWGTWQNRDKATLQILNREIIYCLGMTQSGQPKHPLYISADTSLLPFLRLEAILQRDG